ncbi:MAG: hypothetical protein Q7Q71_09520 [Verrucomicrobiota bacterium JB023]|nr:hypothetical protein [Verrucomicrobiota bacterium JB023]
MKRIAVVLLIVLLLILAGLIWRRPALSQEDPPVAEPSPSQVPASQPPPLPLPGDRMLTGYGVDPEEDKQDFRRLYGAISNFHLLHKGIDPRHWSTNSQLTTLLTSPPTATFSLTNPAIQDGRLVDPHGGEVFIHHLSSKSFQLRGPGSDGILYSEDDLVWPTSLNSP